jgi:hypothetical protein
MEGRIVPVLEVKTVEPLSLSLKDSAKTLSITPRAVYSLIADGKLVARKLGSRTIVDFASVKAYYASLPAKTVAASIPNAPQSTAPRRRRTALRTAKAVRS